MKNHFVVCECNSSEHTLRYIYDKETKELYTEVQLIQCRSFFKKLKVAIMYLLGYTSKYGVWDCTIISRNELDKLKQFLNNLK